MFSGTSETRHTVCGVQLEIPRSVAAIGQEFPFPIDLSPALPRKGTKLRSTNLRPPRLSFTTPLQAKAVVRHPKGGTLTASYRVVQQRDQDNHF